MDFLTLLTASLNVKYIMTIETGKTIYSRTSTGAVQIWRQDREGNKYRTVSGQKGGAQVTSSWTVCEAKNVGRANEVDPIEQANREVEANYKKKLAQGGYKESEKDIDTASFFEPMLAKDYTKKAPKASAVLYSQPKLDGIRCIARASGLWSRSGKPILACPHIAKALAPLFKMDPDLILDGELYNHDLKADFNRIVSLVKQAKPDQEDFKASEEMIQYHVYDLPGTQKFSERTDALRKIVAALKSPYVLYVDTAKVVSDDHLNLIYEAYLEDGFEGQMVRVDGFGYENKRTSNLLKRKEFMDSEFVIVDIVEGEGNRGGMAGYAVLQLTGKVAAVYLAEMGRATFKSNIKGDRDFLRSVLARKSELIGKECTVEYFTPTPLGIPRFPRVKAIHETNRW